MKILSHENECVYNTSTTVYTQKQPSCVTLNYEATSCLIALGSLLQLSQTQYYFRLIIAKLPSQKVCFGGLVRIHTCIMLDLVAKCGCTSRGHKRAPQNIKSQVYLICSMGANTYQ